MGVSRVTAEAAQHLGLQIGPNGGLPPHPYQSDPQSGAGNCYCGRGEMAYLHVTRDEDS